MNKIESMRILVVDDNSAIHEDFKSILLDVVDRQYSMLKEFERELFDNAAESKESTTLYSLDHAYNGDEAIEMADKADAENEPYALIFMDVRMPPGMDGIQTIQKIWANHPEIEMVICTAHSDYNWDQIIEKLGHTDHLLILKKPFDSVAVKQFALTLTTKWKLQRNTKFYTASLEEKVAERTSELQHSLDKLKEAQEQLIQSEKMASLGELVAGVAHEINTPIGVGITAASFIEDTTVELEKKYHDKQISNRFMQEYIQTMVTSSQMLLTNLNRASELIRGFKQVAVDQTIDLKRRFNFHELIQNVLFSLKLRLKQMNIDVVVECDTALEVDSYPGSFSQVFTNLIVNSLVHGFEHKTSGTITIRVSQEKHSLLVVYEDDGCGVEQTLIKKIFDPFYTTKRGRGGTGLGLHIIYNIVSQKLKGKIGCTSEAGKNIRFTIELPLE